MTEERKINVMGDEVVFSSLSRLCRPIRWRFDKAIKPDRAILILQK